VWWGCKNDCFVAWTNLNPYQHFEDNLILHMTQTIDILFVDPDVPEPNCPISYHLNDTYPFITRFNQTSHEHLSIDFYSDDCSLHDTNQTVVIISESNCRDQFKEIVIELRVLDHCMCDESIHLVQSGSEISSEEPLDYHMRNETKFIPTDLLQMVSTNQSCGNISQVVHSITC
jgi:hypothetical protein